MRKLSGIALGALIAVGVAWTASAATLSYTGTLSFRYANIWSGSASGAGTIGAVTHGGHLSTLAFVGGELGPITTSLPMTTTAEGNSVRMTGIAILTGTITGISGGAPLGSAQMGLSGLAKVCLVLGKCGNAQIPFPLSPTGTPLAGMGIGGTRLITASIHTALTYSTPPALQFTFQHNPWTLGQPTMEIHTASSSVTTPVLPGGFAHGPASLTSSTAQPSGALQLVTVSKVFTSLTAAWPEMVHVGILTLHFVPEPGTALLLGTAVVGLAVLGRRRRG
jgi:hypothetical protein